MTASVSPASFPHSAPLTAHFRLSRVLQMHPQPHLSRCSSSLNLRYLQESSRELLIPGCWVSLQASRMVPTGSCGYLSALLEPVLHWPRCLSAHTPASTLSNTFPLPSPRLQTEGQYPILSTLDPIQEIYVPASYKSI